MNKKLILIGLIIIISVVFLFIVSDVENIRMQAANVAQHNTSIGNAIWVKSGDMPSVNFNLLKNAHIDTIFLNYGAIDTYGEDTVTQWIANANNNGIKVHIWMQVLYKDEFQNPLNDNGEINTQLLNKNINDSVKYASIPGVSGIVLDYIRYPGDAGDNPGGSEAINSFVANLSNNIKNLNPNLIVSGTFMPESSRLVSDYGQDLTTLNTYLDYVIPMMYKGNYNQGSYWVETTTRYFAENSGDANVLVSLQTYASDDDITQLQVSELNNDIAEAYIGGTDGVAFFRYGLLDFNDFDSDVDFDVGDIFKIRFNSLF